MEVLCVVAGAISGAAASVLLRYFEQKREFKTALDAAPRIDQSRAPVIRKAVPKKDTSKLTVRVNDDKAAVIKALEESR